MVFFFWSLNVCVPTDSSLTNTSKPISFKLLKDSTLLKTWERKTNSEHETCYLLLVFATFRYWIVHSLSSQAEALFLVAYTRYAANPTTTAAAPTVIQIENKYYTNVSLKLFVCF